MKKMKNLAAMLTAGAMMMFFQGNLPSTVVWNGQEKFRTVVV